MHTFKIKGCVSSAVSNSETKGREFLTSIEACLFKHPFYKRGQSKGIKQRALHVHRRKTKHFISKLFAQPCKLLQTFSILVLRSSTCSKRPERPSPFQRPTFPGISDPNDGSKPVGSKWVAPVDFGGPSTGN